MADERERVLIDPGHTANRNSPRPGLMSRWHARALRLFGGSLGNQNLSVEAPEGVAFLAGKTAAFVAANAWFDGANWQRWDAAQPSYALGPAANGMNAYFTAAGAGAITFTQLNTTWTAPALAANWSDFGAPWQTGAYKRDALNRIHLRGMIKKSIAVVAGETLFTLPAGFRPAAQEYFAINSNGAFGLIFVTAAGAVNLQLGNLTYVSLSGISFDAA